MRGEIKFMIRCEVAQLLGLELAPTAFFTFDHPQIISNDISGAIIADTPAFRVAFTPNARDIYRFP